MIRFKELQLDDKLFVENGNTVSIMSVYDIVLNNTHKNKGLNFYTIKDSVKYFDLSKVLKEGMCGRNFDSISSFYEEDDPCFTEILKSEEFKNLDILINNIKLEYYKLFIKSRVYIDEEFIK